MAPRRLQRHAHMAVLLWALPPALSGASQECKLEESVADLDSGYWKPAAVFRSLGVLPLDVLSPPKGGQSGVLQQQGLCRPSVWRAADFAWQKPTANGGDWIATTGVSEVMQITIDDTPCPMTGIAVAAPDRPSLRLQFDKCPRKAAVEVPLAPTNSSQDGIKLVSWMCTVAAGTSLCQDARAVAARTATARRLTMLPDTEEQPEEQTQEILDLSSLSTVASWGMQSMRARGGCLEGSPFAGLEWFAVDAPLGVAVEEWELLLALTTLLAPKAPVNMHVPAEVEVKVVCMQDCSGAVADRCVPRDVTSVVWVPANGSAALPVGPRAGPWALADEDVRPWLVYLFLACFLIGASASLCCLKCYHRPPEKRERRIKKVSVMYHEVPDESSFVSTAAMR